MHWFAIWCPLSAYDTIQLSIHKINSALVPFWFWEPSKISRSEISSQILTRDWYFVFSHDSLKSIIVAGCSSESTGPFLISESPSCSVLDCLAVSVLEGIVKRLRSIQTIFSRLDDLNITIHFLPLDETIRQRPIHINWISCFFPVTI